MPLSPGFSDFIVELIAGFGPVSIKRMFGGAGVYRDGVGFGILDDDTFFIKADAAFGAELKAQGCKPWSYSLAKDGSVRDIAYWSLPDTALDDPDEAVALVRRSHAIAAQVQKPKKAAAAKAAKPKKILAAAKKPANSKTTKPKPKAHK